MLDKTKSGPFKFHKYNVEQIYNYQTNFTKTRKVNGKNGKKNEPNKMVVVTFFIDYFRIEIFSIIVRVMEILGGLRRQKVGVLSMYSTQEWTCLGTDLINNKMITYFSLPFHLPFF